MYISPKASAARQREAQLARDNRAEIVKALSLGQINRRDLFRWGIFTATGALALKNGLSPFARSAFAAVPTGTPRSNLYGAQKYTYSLPRLALQSPIPLTRDAATRNAVFPASYGELPAKRLSYHTDYSANPSDTRYKNTVSGRGPIEGRPPGEIFAHQRWDEFFPKVGYVMSIGPAAAGTKFHPNFMPQNPNSVWCYGSGKYVSGNTPPPLIKARYGEPVLTRIGHGVWIPAVVADQVGGHHVARASEHGRLNLAAPAVALTVVQAEQGSGSDGERRSGVGVGVVDGGVAGPGLENAAAHQGVGGGVECRPPGLRAL